MMIRIMVALGSRMHASLLAGSFPFPDLKNNRDKFGDVEAGICQVNDENRSEKIHAHTAIAIFH